MTYTARPTARAARIAWNRLQREGDPIQTMHRAHLDYWVWVAIYVSGDTAEVDGLEIAKAVRPSAYESTSRAQA